MNNSFVVPTQYAGKSLKDVFSDVSSKGGYVPDLGTLSSLTGLNADSPLTAGQSITFNKNDPNSGEYKFISSNFTPYQTAQDDKFKSFYDTQKGAVDDYLSRLTAGNTANVAKANTDFNVPGLQGAASALKQRIDLLNTNAANNASGYATQGQTDAASSNLGVRSNIASNAASNAAIAANNEYNQLNNPLVTEGNMLSERLAREATGFTNDQQNQLQLLITKLNNNTALTQTEMNNANQLALQQQQYEQALKNPPKQGNQIQTIGGNTYLIDMNTGQKTLLGSSSTGGGSGIGAYLASGGSMNDINKSPGYGYVWDISKQTWVPSQGAGSTTFVAQ